MARLRRIALFAQPSVLFINVLLALKDGFERIGVEAFVGWPPLSGALLDTFLANHRPDALFEINRTRNQITDAEVPVPHLAWVQDFQFDGGGLLDGFGGSDLTYFMNPPGMFGLDLGRVGAHSVLWPGVDDRIFMPVGGGPAFRWDLSLVGHLYPPVPEAVMDAPMVLRGRECGRFRDFADRFATSGYTEADFSLGKLYGIIETYFRQYSPDMSVADIDPGRMFLFHEVLPRLATRTAIARGMTEVSRDIRFFGSAGWGQWPDFAPHYGGEVADPFVLADIYRSSRLNVHCSVCPMHFRVFDVMGCGGAVMINSVDHPDVTRQLHNSFTPGVHYIEYPIDGFAETARRALAEPDRVAAIRRAAARAVLAEHTWRDRAEQIRRDLDQL